MANKTRLWIVCVLFALVVLAYLVSYANVLDRVFSFTADDLSALRNHLEGVGTALWFWLLDALGIERRRRNPDVPAISDDV